MQYDSYLTALGDRLDRAGYRIEEAGHNVALQARRRELKLTRFGLVETVVGISALQTAADAEDLRAFGADVYRSGLAAKSRVPRGLGSSLVLYPVLVVEHASTDLRTFAADYSPKHWAVVEYPIVVELSTKSLIQLEKTPVWGSAYFRKTRRDAEELFGFAAAS